MKEMVRARKNIEWKLYKLIIMNVRMRALLMEEKKLILCPLDPSMIIKKKNPQKQNHPAM
jgi:hypothetical protein